MGTSTDPLAGWLRQFERVLEVGIGARDDLARRLLDAGVSVVAIDPTRHPMSPDIRFIEADVAAVRPTHLGRIDAVYARNLPPELHRPTVALAKSLEAPCRFTTLGGDPPVVPVTVHTGPATTVYEARGPGSNNV